MKKREKWRNWHDNEGRKQEEKDVRGAGKVTRVPEREWWRDQHSRAGEGEGRVEWSER